MSQHGTFDLVAALGRLAPIASLSLERREEIANLATLEKFSPENGDIDRTKWSGKVVYLLSGEIKLDFAGGRFDVMVGGADIAANPLPSNDKLLHACKPITEVEVLQFDEKTLDMVLAWDQISVRSNATNATDGLDSAIKPGMFSIRSLASGAFASLPAANMSLLLDRLVTLVVKRGEVVVRQGDPGDYYYLIDSGRSIVTRQVGGVEMEIADLKPGDVFGEEALLANALRNATVTMKTDGVLLQLSKNDFFELLSEPLLQRLDWQEAKRRVSSGAQWIDVRYPAEFVHDGLPDAINIPLNEVRRSVPLLDAKREYVTYCQSGRRSSAAAFILSQRGLHASVLAGGMNSRAEPIVGGVVVQ